MTLQDIADDLKRRIATETNSGKVEVFTVIANLVTVLQTKGIPIGDETVIAKLQSQLDGLTRSNNWQAGVLQRIKAALEAPDDVTMEQLPTFAKSILVWAKTGEKPL